jgi:hypothetical protein
MGFSPLRNRVLLKSAYVSRNSACVNTLDFRSPTGRPLADAVPSRGNLRLLGICEEKNWKPSDNDDALVINGEVRVWDDESSCAGDWDDVGWESVFSYMSRRCSKFVGKKISK